ncbi:MAG: hypothetical protein ISQ76_06125 [Opitutales bacterium]|nr:hypothetical protein [Opitutales bacterium]
MKFLFLLSLFGGTFLMAVDSTPIPYSGKVSVDGINYHGEAHFAFSIQDGTGSVHWRNGESANSTILVKVQNGRYSVLVGGQGMKALSPQLFLNHSILFLHVRFDNGDGQGLRHLAPDQRIHSTPHSLVAEVAKSALSAETAKSAEVAETAKAVEAGAISKQMLGQDVLSDLNRTITHNDLSPQIFEARNYPLSAGTRFDLWRADRHPAFPCGGQVFELSMVQEWSADRRGDG